MSFGVDLDDSLRAAGVATVRQRAITAPTPGQGVHLQFTDRLFGADAQRAVAVVRDLAADIHRGGGRITATLHDLPQPSDGANCGTRTQAYASLAGALDGMVVCSEHERSLLHDIGVRESVTVIPLPIAPQAPGERAQPGPPSVAVFGFIYPGKGHAEVLDAMAGLPPDVRMMAIGEPSAGHDDLVDDLRLSARAQERPFVMTGHVPDDAIVRVLQAVTVPVAHHRHVSASASLNSWLSAGRRPLVTTSRYVREVADRNPDALWLYDDDPGSLSAAIRSALDEQSSTWLPPGTVCVPTPSQVAESYGRWLGSMHG